jgi:hypothetical protein
MSTFQGGIYRSGYSEGVTVLHRAGDTGFQKEFGGFWAADAPTSVAQVRNDKAILPEWYQKRTREITDYSPINRGYTAEFREGTPVYSGTVASQTGIDGTVYPGGTPQVHIPQSYTQGRIINDWDLN